MRIKCTYMVTWVYTPEESTMAELLGPEGLTMEEAKVRIEKWMKDELDSVECTVDNSISLPYLSKFTTEWIDDEGSEEN